MIKIWKGIEKEGIGPQSEIPTLFICSDTIIDVDIIFFLLRKNPEVRGLYFGAGREEFHGINPKDWDRLIIHCEKEDISIIVEVNPTMLEVFTHLYNHSRVTFVVSYYNVPKNINRLYFKTDDFITTKIFVSQKNVDITEVADNRYPDDIVLYEKEN